jgi:hypothetical protein
MPCWFLFFGEISSVTPPEEERVLFEFGVVGKLASVFTEAAAALLCFGVPFSILFARI